MAGGVVESSECMGLRLCQCARLALLRSVFSFGAPRYRLAPPTGFGSPGPSIAKLPQLSCPLRQGLSLASSRPCASPPFWRVGARRQPDPRMGWAGSRVVVLLRRASRVAGWRGGPSGDLWSIACTVLRGARQRSRRLCGTIVTVHPKGVPPHVGGAPDGHEWCTAHLAHPTTRSAGLGWSCRR